MTDKAKKVIRNILIGAIATLYNTDVQASTNGANAISDGFSEADKKGVLRAIGRRMFKNVLQLTRNGDTKILAGHTSHRSHSSHSSHRSSRGGHTSHASHYSSTNTVRTTPTVKKTTPKQETVSNTQKAKNTTRTNTVASTNPAKTFRTFSLGDRTFRKGMYGNDVYELTSLLVSKMYMRRSWISKKQGYPVYDSQVERAVRQFQKDLGAPETGIITTDQANTLKSWIKEKTTLVLGIRDFGDKMPFSGRDVTELVTLLQKTGYPPDPTKLQEKDTNYIYTEDVKTAVKLFQAYNNLEPNGLVNEKTVEKLRAAAK